MGMSSTSGSKGLLAAFDGELARNTAATVIVTDAAGCIEWVNPAFAETTGYTLAEVLGKRPGQVLQGPDSDPNEVARMRDALARQSGFEGEILNYHKDGSPLWMHLTVDPVFDDAGNLLRFIAVQTNVTERRLAEQSLRLANSQLAATLESTTDGILVTDLNRNLTCVNQRFRQMWRIPEELVDSRDGCAIQFLVSQLKDPEAAAAMVERLYSFPEREDFAVLELQDGRTFERNSLPQYIGGRAVGRVCSFRDISERMRQASRIEHLAYYDALTGLPNRTLFQEHLSRALAAAAGGARRLALVFLDLDRFKEINDSLGHAVGDQALVELARRLQAVTREGEMLARQGGDEFVLIVENAEQGTAELIAARMLNVLVEPIVVAENVMSVRGSIGIALYPDDGATPDELIRHTDIAMYRAKADGGGFRLYQREMGVELEQRIRMVARLGVALDQGQLELFYQPQLSLKTGKLIGAEALLRWRDSEYGWVSPARFIPLAEERGMMGAVGDWVLGAACRQLNDWQEAGLDFPGRLSVNVSAKQLLDPEFASRILAIVRAAGLTPERFDLELTESSMMADPEGAAAIMDALSKAGFTLAIDDFGTGYSSLSYLKRFSVDRIKIDISFVRDMLSDDDDYAIVKAIIAMADSLGLETIAEGVEHAAQAAALTELGCHLVQGFHFGRPQPAHVFAGRQLGTMLVDPDKEAR